MLDDAAPRLTRHVRDRILDEARGNPLVLVELARSDHLFDRDRIDDALALAPTARLERVFAGRVAAMPAATQLALLVAAASDVAETPAVIRATELLGLPSTAFVAAERDGLLTMTADTYRFRHPIVRSCVYHAATEADRRAAHQALANALATTPERAAWHLASVASEPDEAIAASLEEAAGTARLRAGHAAASRAMRRGAALTPVPRSGRGGWS